MNVPSYQMHNVLNVYSKQLRQNITSRKNNQTPEKFPPDLANLTPEGKRKATMEKVSKDIFNKITQFGSLTETRHRITEHAKGKTDKKTAGGKTNKTTFTFNVIDTINKKKTNTLSVEDCSLLIQRLDQFSIEAGAKRRNPGFEDRKNG